MKKTVKEKLDEHITTELSWISTRLSKLNAEKDELSTRITEIDQEIVDLNSQDVAFKAAKNKLKV